MTSTVPERIGNKAPDWGISYGIKELWSEVAPGLFVGGTADEDIVGVPRDRLLDRPGLNLVDAEITTEEFDAVVTMYAWAQPADWGVEELRWGIMDSEYGRIDVEALRDTVVWAHRRWKAGKRVLIRCQAGLNRSSLVAGLVLVREGMEGQEAVDKIRRTRSYKCLFNRRFEKLVIAASNVDADFWRRA